MEVTKGNTRSLDYSSKGNCQASCFCSLPCYLWENGKGSGLPLMIPKGPSLHSKKVSMIRV